MGDTNSFGLEIDEKGNIDVQKEISSLEKLQSTGMDISRLKKLLADDPESYKRAKIAVLRQQLKVLQREAEPTTFETLPSSRNDEVRSFPPAKRVKEPLPVVRVVRLAPDEDIKIEEGSSFTDTPEIIIGAPDEKMERSVEKPPQEPQRKPEPPAELKKGPVQGPSISKKGRNDKRNLGAGMFITALVLILIIGGGLGYYFFIYGNGGNGNGSGELDANFLISDVNPRSGSVIALVSSASEKDTVLSWMIVPQTYSIWSGSLSNLTLEVFFQKGGTYRITLQVSDSEDTVSTAQDIEVIERTIVLEREHYGDTAEYDVEGDLTLRHINNILRSTELLSYDTLFLRYWTEDGAPSVSGISMDPLAAKDGLGMEYSHMRRTTEQTFTYLGYVEKKDGLRSTLTGSSDILQENSIDLFLKRPTSYHSKVTTDISIQLLAGKLLDYDMQDEVWNYPLLSRSQSELSIEDISPTRNITVDDSGETMWGSYRLMWKGMDFDRVFGRPCLRVSFSLDASTMLRLDIEEFSMQMWIADEIPVAVRTLINITSKDTISNPYVLDHEQTMSGWNSGDLPIIYRTSSSIHDDISNIREVYPDLAGEFHENWTYVPVLGTFPCSIPSDFDAEDAVDRFKDDADFKSFARNRDELYALYSNFSTQVGKDQWQFSLGEDDDEYAWNQTVREDAFQQGVPAKVDPVRISRSEIGSILSYSGSETALKRVLSKINRDACTRSYGVQTPSDSSKLITSTFAIGTVADSDYPMLGMVNPTLSEKLDLCLWIGSMDGTVSIGLDMGSGQIAYIKLSSAVSSG